MANYEMSEDMARVAATCAPASIRDCSQLNRQWAGLACQSLAARRENRSLDVNNALLDAAKSDPDAPTASVFRLWIADNNVAAGDWQAAMASCDEMVEAAGRAESFLPNGETMRLVRLRHADIAASAGEAGTAISVWRDLWSSNRQSKFEIEGMLLAGGLAENSDKIDEAAEIYQAIAAAERNHHANPEQFALRNLQRLEGSSGTFAPSVSACRNRICTALEDRNTQRLDELVSRTHFSVSVGGDAVFFADDCIRERILANIMDGPVVDCGALLGSGNKRYLFSDGWEGDLLRGRVGFVFMCAPQGWQFHGVILSVVPEELIDLWAPKIKRTNQPLPFAIKAPWANGRKFMAGGLAEYSAKVLAVAASGFLAPAVAFAFSRADCGFGLRGFYYNDLLNLSHDDEDAFSIDFTCYRTGVPHDNMSAGTPVLAVAPGTVAFMRDCTFTGEMDSPANRVAISHPDPVNPGDTTRYTSQYLHLTGPNMIAVSMMMPVMRGQPLGLMNDTGVSRTDHLHFSIHDRNIPFVNSSFGGSMRPSPMDGQTLGDDDSGKLILSSNKRPSVDDAEFVSQNVPSTLRPGEQRTLTITMRNISNVTWAAGYKLASLLTGLAPDDVVIGQPVNPGDSVTVQVQIVSFSVGDFQVQWRMARPFVGLFGEATPRTNVRVELPDVPTDCGALDRSLNAADEELRSLQDLLATVPPPAKAEVVVLIRGVEGRIVALKSQKERAGCP